MDSMNERVERNEKKAKRVKKPTVKELRSKLLHAGDTIEGLYELVRKKDRQLEEVHRELGEAQESQLAQATTICGLQDEKRRAVESIENLYKVIASRDKEIEWNRTARLIAKGQIDELGLLICERDKELDKFNNQIEMICNASAPVNAMADPAPREPAPIIETIYRVVTNGKRYSPEVSKDGGGTWTTIWIVTSYGPTNSIKYRSYRGAMKYLRKQYGEKADILPREWRAV